MSVVEVFQAHVRSVERLMNFDRDVMEFAIERIEALCGGLKRLRIDNAHLNGERTLQMLRGYRSHDSLRPRFEAVFNQALVLLSSYFASCARDVLRNGIQATSLRDSENPLMKEQVKISLRELRDLDFQLKDAAPDLFIEAKDISFSGYAEYRPRI
jgi:hypothetical protein